MGVEIKFCGLTRREDANHAVALGASYVGVIFAGGPRLVTPDRAAGVLRDVPATVRRVGVFGDQDDAAIARAVETAALDVVQLHGGWDPERVRRLGLQLERDVWPVVRIEGALPPDWIADAFALGARTVVDTLVPGQLGGTGVALPWVELSGRLATARRRGSLVLAGGLNPDNVPVAIGALAPAVVDVSSGVESAPGIKDHGRMRAFRDAVAHSAIEI